MKKVTLNFTAEDLDNDMSSVFRCAGYKASKRVLPQTNCFSGVFHGPYLKTGSANEHEEGTLFRMPQDAIDKLSAHARWVWSERVCGEKTEPFSCVIEVPDHIPTTEE